MDRCTGCRDIAEILLKLAFNTIQSINPYFFPCKFQTADEQLRSVSLHHLIRMKGETYAEDITAMDRQFKANNYAPDPIKVKKYVHLIREASIQMIRKYDVILCTTAVGSNPKVLEASNIFQVFQYNFIPAETFLFLRNSFKKLLSSIDGQQK